MVRPEWAKWHIAEEDMAMLLLAGYSKPVQCGRCLHVARGTMRGSGGDLCDCCFSIVFHTDSVYDCDGSLIHVPN